MAPSFIGDNGAFLCIPMKIGVNPSTDESTHVVGEGLLLAGKAGAAVLGDHVDLGLLGPKPAETERGGTHLRGEPVQYLRIRADSIYAPWEIC
jgi:hypothetical protein